MTGVTLVNALTFSFAVFSDMCPLTLLEKVEKLSAPLTELYGSEDLFNTNLIYWIVENRLSYWSVEVALALLNETLNKKGLELFVNTYKYKSS